MENKKTERGEKNMKKLLFGLLGLTLILGLIACGNNNNNDDETTDNTDAGVIDTSGLPEPRFTPDPNIPSWQQDYDHYVELTWYINYGWFAAVPWGTDVPTRQMQTDLGITINFIVGDTDNLNTMIAGGDLPDIITMGGYLDITREAYRFAHPLNVLAELYDPYFLEHAAKPDSLAWHTLPNGNIYGYPNFSTTAEDVELGRVQGNQAFMVRRDIYEAIGSPDMSTPDGFLDALRAAVAHTPEADHGVPLIAFAGNAMDMASGDDGSFGESLQDFLGIPVIDENGEFYDRDANPEYLAWLQVFRQALSEGLMTNDQFSDDGSIMNERQTLGTYFAFLESNLNGLVHVLHNNNDRAPEQEYIPVRGPSNSNGADPDFAAGGIGGWVQTFVTTQAEDPQTAMQVITYLVSEHGQVVNAFGIEGETFNWVDGMAEFTEEVAALSSEDLDYMGIRKYWLLQDSAFTNSIGGLPPVSLAPHIEWSTQYLVPRFHMEDIDPIGDSSIGRSLATIDTNRTQAIVAVMQAPDDATAEQIWNDFLASRENNDWAEILAYRNERIADNMDRLGLR